MMVSTLPKRQKRITLRDVITHIQGAKGELKEDIKGLKDDVKGLKEDVKGIRKGIRNLSTRVDEVEKNLTERIDALDEDLTATMQDTVKIRQHVGIAVVGE